MRRTGIERKTPLHRGSGQGLKPGVSLKRVTPLKAGKPLARKSELPRRSEIPAAAPDHRGALEPLPKPRKAPRNTGPSRAVRDALKARANYMCEYCGLRPGTEAHHRQGRKMGGTRRPRINKLSNLVLLCAFDHEAITNTRGHRAALERAGWLVREGLLEPADVPVEHAARGRVLLLDNGDTKPAPKRKRTS